MPRCMPLLQAAFLKIGMGYLSSGFVIEFASMIAILIASYRLMRRLGASKLNAGCFTCLILAASGVNSTLAANKDDLLAAAFSLWGMFFVTSFLSPGPIFGVRVFSSLAQADSTREEPSPILRKLPAQGEGEKQQWLLMFAASLCFSLAIATKVTAIFGLAAATIWLFSQGKKKPAILICALWFIFTASIAIAVQYASQGARISIFLACAAGGGGQARAYFRACFAICKLSRL